MSSDTAARLLRHRQRSNSESENPAIASPTPKADAPSDQPGLVARADRRVGAARALVQVQPARRRLRLRDRIRQARRRRAQGRRRRGDHHFAGLVARRLRQLRRPVHPDELARRGHLPHLRRPRRRRPGHAALRPAQQLARQRQPGQGASPAVAGQAEVRQQDLVGRPAGVRRQRRAGVVRASRRSVSASAAPTSGSRKRSSSASKRTWLGTDKRYSGERELSRTATAPPRWA